MPTNDPLVEQLTGLLETRLLDPLEIVLDDPLPTLRERARTQARHWADTLRGDDLAAARLTAARVIAALYPGDTAFDPPPAWWRTPLGGVVARRLGHPGATAVSYAVAGAMLGITRQGVHDLLVRGKLTRHPDGGVDVASVQARLTALDTAQETR
ncbi:MAG TPA: hypothetical protein VI076_00815 [Actinopolymorphaceae bacterium]